MKLINDCIENKDAYWTDFLAMSQPKKNKWVRNASKTNLGKLLKRIDAKVLKPHDNLLPGFIFGGVSGLNHKAAVLNLLGNNRHRILLKMDVSRFFEQVKEDRVYHLFLNKCGCSDRAARLLAKLCCVPYGSKDKPGDYNTIARGFSTSPRLAVWCNLDTFLKVERLVMKELKGKDPRISIYVDDIGITASKATKEDMMRIFPMIKKIMEQGDKNQKLPLNPDKTKIIYHSGETFNIEGEYLGKWGFEILGLQMNRNSVTLGTKTRWKLADLSHKLKLSHGKDKLLRRRRKSTVRYKNYVQK